MLIAVPALSFFQRGEKVLMNATRLMRSWSVNGAHDGILELSNPRPMELYKSESRGRVPVGVERHLKVACVKFRGLGDVRSVLPCAIAAWPMAANAIAAVELLTLVRMTGQLADLGFLCASRRKISETG